MNFANYRIIENAAAFSERYQLRFPKSKKKRMRKKWARQARNYAWRIQYDIVVDETSNILYMHPVTAHRVRAIQREQKRQEGAPDYLWPFAGMLR